MESDDILYVCITCKKNGEAVEPRPGKILYDNLKRLNSKMNIKPVRCLAGCSNGCTLSLANKNKSVSYTHLRAHEDATLSRMPSSA